MLYLWGNGSLQPQLSLQEHDEDFKPPGVSSFSVEPFTITHEPDDAVDVLDSLPLGAIFLDEMRGATSNTSEMPEVGEQRPPVTKLAWPGPRSVWRDHSPYWQEPGIAARVQIGDCYAMVADAILTRNQPFLGDEYYDCSEVLLVDRAERIEA